MSYESDQLFVLPPPQQEWLPQDHLVSFPSNVVDQLDLSAISRIYEEESRGYPLPSPDDGQALVPRLHDGDPVFSQDCSEMPRGRSRSGGAPEVEAQAAKPRGRGARDGGSSPQSPPGVPAPKVQRNFMDPEFSIMKNADKAFVQAYNAQAAGERSHQVTVACAVTNHASDAPHAVALADAVIANTGQAPTCPLADAGYWSEDNVRALTGPDRAVHCPPESQARGVPAPARMDSYCLESQGAHAQEAAHETGTRPLWPAQGNHRTGLWPHETSPGIPAIPCGAVRKFRGNGRSSVQNITSGSSIEAGRGSSRELRHRTPLASPCLAAMGREHLLRSLNNCAMLTE